MSNPQLCDAFADSAWTSCPYSWFGAVHGEIEHACNVLLLPRALCVCHNCLENLRVDIIHYAKLVTQSSDQQLSSLLQQARTFRCCTP